MPRGHGPRLKSRNNKADYENRLRMVGRMAIRVITEGEIAMALGIDQATVSRDLDEIRQRNLKDIEEKYPQDEQKKLLAEMDAHLKEVERELWSVVDNGSIVSRVAALRAIREVWADRIELLLRLGLVSAQPSNTEPSNYDEFLFRIEARKKEHGEGLNDST